MDIKIKYNEIKDEFSNDLNLVMRLQNYINNYFSPAYQISKVAPIYLVGGSIRDLIYAKKPKDLDFVVLGKENLNIILNIFKKFNIKYSFNNFGGFKFEYKGTIIDLWLADELYSSIQYNVDGLFFDLKTNTLLSLTFEDFINNGLKLINNQNNINNDRMKKLLIFEKQFKYDNKN